MGVVSLVDGITTVESNPTSVITKGSDNTLVDIVASINSGLTFHSGLKADVESGKFGVGDLVYESDTGCISCVDGDGNRVLIDMSLSSCTIPYTKDDAIITATAPYENEYKGLEELKCNNCGSSLKMKPRSSICTCDYCGSTYRFK